MSLRRKISPYGQMCLRHASPFAGLLVRIGQGLSRDDSSNLGTILLADEHVRYRDLIAMKSGSEMVNFIYGTRLISRDDSSYLENSLSLIGRKDLAKELHNFMEQQTNLQVIVTNDKGTANELGLSRSRPEGESVQTRVPQEHSSTDMKEYSLEITEKDCSESDDAVQVEEITTSSQMSVDDLSPPSSQMSIDSEAEEERTYG